MKSAATEFNPLEDLHKALLQESACAAHGALRQSQSLEEAALWWESIGHCSAHNRQEHLRWLGRNDLFFLLRYLLRCTFIEHQWFFDRCQEIQAEPNNCIDLWSRGGGKSTVITFGKTIQDILCDPNQTFGIFSHTKPIAKRFLRQIKTEFESNDLLKETFPDILWQNPQKESPKWSEDEGIIVKRTSNPKEATIEAHGLTDGQPTSSHFGTLVYDDVIDEKAVTSPEMIDKVTKYWELSLNLAGDREAIRFRVAGTFYSVGDTYHTMIERGFGKLRARPIVVGNKSLLLSEERLAQLKQSMSPRTWALQILLDPRQSDKERGFKQEWLRHWKVKPSIKALNRYIFCDPGGKGEESTSYTAMVVVGLGADRHTYVLNIVKDRLNLVQRAETLFQLHREYTPLGVYYERYSMQADIEHIRSRMSTENYHFTIHEVGAIGAQLSKERRIEKLQPDFAGGLILLPPMHTIKRVMHDGKERDMVVEFINNEYLPFPYTRINDVFDALARMKDPVVNLSYPRAYGKHGSNEHWRGQGYDGGSWLSE